MFRLKRSKADVVFSNYIRTRDKWTCQRCKKRYEPPTAALHCSHYYGRAGKSTRWDEDNAVALCWGCHQWMAAYPADHGQFFLKRLGEERYNDLVIRAHRPVKVDEKFIAKYWQEKLEKIQEELNDQGY